MKATGGFRSSVSLSRRVTLATLLVFVVVLAAVVGIVYSAMSVVVDRSVGAILTEHAQFAKQLAAHDTPAPSNWCRGCSPHRCVPDWSSATGACSAHSTTVRCATAPPVLGQSPSPHRTRRSTAPG